MKGLYTARLTLECAAVASLLLVAEFAAAQSISSEMDQINARIRANAAEMKGKQPQEVQLWTSGRAGSTGDEKCERLLDTIHNKTTETPKDWLPLLQKGATIKQLNKEYEMRCLGVASSPPAHKESTPITHGYRSSDRTSWNARQVGNQTFINDSRGRSTICNTYGNQTFCN